MILWKKMILLRLRIYGKRLIINSLFMWDKSILIEVMVIQEYYNKSNPSEVLNEQTTEWIKKYWEKYRQIWESWVCDKDEIKNMLYK